MGPSRYHAKNRHSEVQSVLESPTTDDKWEWRNLATDPEYAGVKKKMRKGIPAHHEPMGALQAAFERKSNVR